MQPCAIYKLMTASAKIGKAVRRIRLLQKKTAEELGEVIGVSKVEMTRKERGLSPFSMEQVEAIAKELNMPMLNLVKEASTPQDETDLALVAGILGLDDAAKQNMLELINQLSARRTRALPAPKKRA